MGFTYSALTDRKIPLTSFTGEITYSLGTIQLVITAGGIRKPVNFVVVDRTAPYNAILGRPWISTMKAVPSTYHQCAKILISYGIKTIRGNQEKARTCYMSSFKQIVSSPA
ncbi:unnamed protein product [Microthlaspi erraticum]|uniref:Uncharacterized protein n=1 Tax=Microthlaspi erraticum TaxID=1685480 RepID=A0A6D2KE74_9BRAS|nr:unnamed protein product [Microthlaspi erraticum]